MKAGDPCAVWQRPLTDQSGALKRCVDEGMAKSSSPNRQCDLFFRADDIGVPSENIRQLLALFARYQTPLALAVVPAWLTAPQWRELHRFGGNNDRLWCWHQHGWQHKNHTGQGKKAEFGDNRTSKALRRDIQAGRQRLEALLSDELQPLFTPPWNRCGTKTLELLPRLGFKALSRDTGSRPEAPPGLTEWPVNVDLHTRKEPDPQTGYDRLMADVEAGVASGVCGIMIHHDLMNSAAFYFLKQLLEVVTTHAGIRLVSLSRCLKGQMQD